MAERMKLGDRRKGSVKVTAVRLGDGCHQYCASCGAYPDTSEPDELKRALTMLEVSRERIRDGLLREVETKNGGEVAEGVAATRVRLIDLFANYVTTDVNQEPLDGDSFFDFAELVKELSKDSATGESKSRVVCVSHGLRVSPGKAAEVIDSQPDAQRLCKIVKMMDRQDVFVLSMDRARSQGRISHEVNVNSYVETLDRLKPALKKGARVTISIQGNDDPDSELYRGKAHDLCDEVLEKLEKDKGWGREEIIALHRDSGRAWVRVGRSETLPGVGPAGECPVIPDNSLVFHTLDIKHSLMAVVDMVSGRVFMHDHNAKKTYNDVARLSWIVSELRAGRTPVSWHGWWEAEVNGVEQFPDLTEEFRAQFQGASGGRGVKLRTTLAEPGVPEGEGHDVGDENGSPAGAGPRSPLGVHGGEDGDDGNRGDSGGGAD